MKATLEFNFPEDKEAYEIANKALDYKGALGEIQHRLKDTIKHSLEEVPQSYHDIQAMVFEVLNAYDIRD